MSDYGGTETEEEGPIQAALDTVSDIHQRLSWMRIKVSCKVMFEMQVNLCLRFLFYMLVYVQRVKTSKRFGN